MLRGAVLACCLVLGACATAETPPPDGPTYLGQQRLTPGETFDGTAVGGLSGISYDPGSRLYYIVSDDRSAKNPARFYTARITLSDNGIDGVEFVSTHPWRNVDGRPFAPLDTATRPPVVPPDPEGIAFDGGRQRLYWSSEGEREGEALLDPWVRIATLDGAYVGEFALPPSLHVSAGQAGPRQNRALEGLALTPSGRYLWVAMEGPGSPDGPLPTEADGALTRVTQLDVETRSATAQYAYPVDRVSAGPDGDNGLTDLVALDDQTFLTVERGYGTHVAARLYRVSVGDAEDVLARPSLAGARPMTKTLLADLTATVEKLDNIEGITLGPQLPDGRQSLLLVSDDNFSPQQVTQFVAFAL
ncbi:esterase-like activity of phytase family protein [Mycobacterium deserti]|uniref:Esterase-like activity of phytase family protein n=1 Tax=Mycobacterium deserti TaxID=2978347 RepID=A0ABT2MDJ3_9MYCO|nr:esterase-like activity of phytase family protein [Mycobacterium deserti]MCT7660335.1 esterase-like activity of phytase family protein [Mycobacterium deserti]